MLSPILIDVERPRATTGTTSAHHATKATVGEAVPVVALVVKDGHDQLGAAVHWSAPSGRSGRAPLRADGDRWVGTVSPAEVGAHVLRVVAWTDRFGTWRRDVIRRAEAGQDVTIELEVGARLVEHLAGRAEDPADAERLTSAAKGLRRDACSIDVRLAVGLDEAVAAAAERVEPGWDRSESTSTRLWVDRARAGFSTWYELFPRSYGGVRGVRSQLPRLADMGFDVLYLPPIHPIGTTHRKGRNNTLVAQPGDVGSPWAIGSPAGGHDAIDPDLGTVEDFVELVGDAAGHGIEVALDYALQCSPDHPWVAQHPEWFNRRPDGTIRFAENPPKQYQDIYPINFWPEREADRAALWAACHAVLEHWIGLGVRIFRVDNPHTKPLAFWAWLIAEVLRSHPDVIFLAEAFTAPAMMARLAEVGFAQSYTYFTWRHSRGELTEYLQQLASPPLVDVMRPNFWPNTPDILEGVLRGGPISAFALRFVLAATLVPNYGVYSGFELGENQPAAPDNPENTEYVDSEKYQLRARNFGAQPNLRELIGRVNWSRRQHPALQQLRTLRFHGADNDALVVYSKTAPAAGAATAATTAAAMASGARPGGRDVVLVVVNLDPHSPQATTLHLDLGALGLDADRPVEAHDELIDTTFTWHGPHPWVRLDPASQPAHLLHLRQP